MRCSNDYSVSDDSTTTGLSKENGQFDHWKNCNRTEHTINSESLEKKDCIHDEGPEIKNKNLPLFIFASACACGLFFESFAAVASVICLLLLMMQIRKNASVKISENIFTLFLLLLPLLFLITELYAVDWGVGLLGVVKFLPVSTALLLAGNTKKADRENIMRQLPYMTVALTMITLALFVTPLKEVFFINGRYSGTFQYANSYAAFLMINLFLLLFPVEQGNIVDEYKADLAKQWGRIAATVILMVGLIATGCRAVFFLFLIGTVAGFIQVHRREKHREKSFFSFKNSTSILIPAIIVVIVGSIVAALISGDGRTFARYTKIHLTSSSLAGRLLYNMDGLRILLAHPFGLGYKGYLFYQGTTQTGNYSVTYVHNELLQTALDIGIIPAIFVLIGFLKIITRRKSSIRNKIIFFTAGIHGIFDWDFQFPVILIVLGILALEDENYKIISLKKASKGICLVIYTVLLTGCLWLGTASILEQMKQYEAAVKLYPAMTTAQMHVIRETKHEMAKYHAAESICSRNQYCTIALQAMAEKEGKDGNFDEMVWYAKKAMQSSRYNKSGYEIYIYMLSYAVEESNAAGNREAVLRYLKDVLEAEKQMDIVKRETSFLAKYLYSSPEIRLDAQYLKYLRQTEEILAKV